MILIVDMNREKDSLGLYEFALPIAYNAESAYEIVHWSDVTKKTRGRARKIILSGVPLKDNFCSTNPGKFGWIRDCEKPVLGICAGIQVIGMVFGGSLEKCQEIGMTGIKTVRSNPLFEGEFEAYELHNFSVSVPKEFEILAESEKCVQAIKHRNKEIYGVMFHPEVRNNEIIRNFLGLDEK